MRRRIECRCGLQVTTNTWKNHLLSVKCTADNEEKLSIINVLNIKTKHTWAFLKSDKEEALGDTDWFMSVINGSTKLEDWSFVSPRVKGAVRKTTADKMSVARKGSNNPTCLGKMNLYSIEDIKKTAKELFDAVKNDETLHFSFISKELNKKFKGWRYMMADFQAVGTENRGHNKANQVLSNLLELDVREFCKLSALRRGKFIRENLLNNEDFLKKASKNGSNMTSVFRTTMPHLILFEMIKACDHLATIEYKVCINDKWKSYDIYSPKINAFIEMHGRVFHDIKNTKPKLIEVAAKNAENDLLKERFAKNNQKLYIVFWDDQCHQWEQQIKEIYNLENLPEEVNYAKCKDKVFHEKRKRCGL